MRRCRRHRAGGQSATVEHDADIVNPQAGQREPYRPIKRQRGQHRKADRHRADDGDHPMPAIGKAVARTDDRCRHACEGK